MQEAKPRPGYSTDEAARLFHVKAQTLRAALCRDGHYLGIQPHKLGNRLLSWPVDQVDQKAGGAA